MTCDQAISFIRDTLGCRRPPELFQDLTNEVDLSGSLLYDAFSAIDQGLPPFLDRILSVGGRLLVVVTRASDKETVYRMLEAGMAVRDNQGFNRFRLVVMASAGRQMIDEELSVYLDDRVHLHILDLRGSPVT